MQKKLLILFIYILIQSSTLSHSNTIKMKVSSINGINDLINFVTPSPLMNNDHKVIYKEILFVDKLYNYIKDITKIKLPLGPQQDPWIECINKVSKITFSSGSINSSKYTLISETPKQDPIKDWIVEFFEKIKNKRIHLISCFYEVTSFNICSAKGLFSLELDSKYRITTFKSVEDWKECDSSGE